MILLIDNYDSFTYNLAQMIGALKMPFQVWRNDTFQMKEVERLKPSCLVISPGPGRPENAGNMPHLLQVYLHQIPVLGICLGHQALAHICGAKIVHAPRLMHGKTSTITHREHPLFKGLSENFTAARYHSLTISEESLPSCLEVICRDEGGEIMGIQHQNYPAMGLQFHPESIATPQGEIIMSNWIDMFNLRS